MITHWEDIAASSLCVCVLSGQVTIWRWCSTGKHSHPTPIIPYFPRGHPISGLEIRELRNDPRNKLNRPDLSIFLSICLSASLKTKLFCEISWVLNLTTSKTQQFCESSSIFQIDSVKKEAILRDFLNFGSWQHQKTKQSCETSSIFQIDSAKNEAILGDFLNFGSWQHQKQSNPARRPQFFKLTAPKTKQF